MGGNAPIFRLGMHFVASLGVSKVINDIIVNNTNVVTTADAVRVWTGAIVIGSMIADQASKHVDERVTAVIAWNQARKVDTPTET